MKAVRVVIVTGAFLAALVPCGLLVAVGFLLLPQWSMWLGLAMLAGAVVAVILRRRATGVSVPSEYALIGRQRSKDGLL